MPRFLKVLLAAVAGFIVAALGGCAAVELLSTANIQDRSLEQSVMSLFVFGPIGSFAAGTWAFLRHSQP
jgi:high-affinity Fe2+/Pb2+ permease